MIFPASEKYFLIHIHSGEATMGLFGTVSGKDIDQFAKSLAEAVAKRYPPSLERSAEKKVSVTRVTKVLEDALANAAEFAKEKKLGTFNKARLGNSFKWELKELGYGERFIEVATEGLIVYITRRDAGDAGTARK